MSAEAAQLRTDRSITLGSGRTANPLVCDALPQLIGGQEEFRLVIFLWRWWRHRCAFRRPLLVSDREVFDFSPADDAGLSHDIGKSFEDQLA
jgi:hypothetical protein